LLSQAVLELTLHDRRRQGAGEADCRLPSLV
jgi:hypothetical protein